MVTSIRVNQINPIHITAAAKKSLVPYFFPWIIIPPTNTGISLHDLKITYYDK